LTDHQVKAGVVYKPVYGLFHQWPFFMAIIAGDNPADLNLGQPVSQGFPAFFAGMGIAAR